MKKLFYLCAVLMIVCSASAFCAADEFAENIYVEDFESFDTERVGVPYFKGDFGECTAREVRTDGIGKAVYIERNLKANDTAAYLIRSLTEEISEAEGYTVEFSAKFEGDKSRWLTIYSAEGLNITFEVGRTGMGKVNGKVVSLPSNTDGKYHSYKMVVSADKRIRAYYDGEELSGSFEAKFNGAPIRYRLSVGRSEDEANGAYFDNIMIYGNDNPAPSMPRFEIVRGGLTEIAADSDCTVRYTTDGSYPDESAAVYEAPVSVEDGAYLRAVAVRDTDGEVSACADNGPYPIEYEEKPIIPVYGDKMYLMDFEKTEVGAIGTGLGIFDNDWGMCESKDIISENGNKAAKLVKKLSSVTTGAWLQHRFEGDKIIDKAFVFEFSLKQTLDRAKWVNLYNSQNDIIISFEFGAKDTGKLNGTALALPSNIDGEYHSYRFEVSDNGSVKLFYDGKRIDGDFSAKGAVELARFRFTAGGTETEGESNYFILDNICAYEKDAPIAAMPAADRQSGFYPYGSTVELSSDDGEIYYTTDGTYPVLTSAYLYSEPIVIDRKDVIIRAVTVGANGSVSACAYYGPFSPENENSLVVLTENPFNTQNPKTVSRAGLHIICLEESMDVTLVLCLYKNGTLIGSSAAFSSESLSEGENTVEISTKANDGADEAILYVWSERDGSFAPLTHEWTLKGQMGGKLND